MAGWAHLLKMQNDDNHQLTFYRTMSGQSRSSHEYDGSFSLSPGRQQSMSPVVPSRNSNSPFHPENIPEPVSKNLSISPFTTKLPTSLQSQLDVDFGFNCNQDQIKYEYDSTGIFHWCPAREMDRCLVSRQEIARSVSRSRSYNQGSF